jgi:hypothetical protein
MENLATYKGKIMKHAATYTFKLSELPCFTRHNDDSISIHYRGICCDFIQHDGFSLNIRKEHIDGWIDKLMHIKHEIEGTTNDPNTSSDDN